jgi:hypothetical protein
MIAVFVSLTLGFAVACETEPPSSSSETGDSQAAPRCGDSSGGRAYFDAHVQPILESSCASCHSTKYNTPYPSYAFLDGPTGDYYEALVSDVRMVNADPGNSLLLLKGPHTGPGLTTEQDAAVREWLDIEKAKFGGTCETSTEPPGLTCAEAEDQFGKCMKLEDWVGTGVPDIALQQTLAYDGQVDAECHSCHDEGMAGNCMAHPMNASKVESCFEMMKKRPFIEKLVRCEIDPATGSFQDLVPSGRWNDKGFELKDHVRYTLSPEYADALDAWFELVYQMWKNSGGQCQ